MGAPLAVGSPPARRLILSAHFCKESPGANCPGYTCECDEDGCKGEGAHERGPDHDCGETEVGDEPDSYEVRLEVGGAHE